MNARMHQKGLADIVAQFADWINTLSQRFTQREDETHVQQLEQELRDGGRAILLETMQHLLQQSLDQQREQARTCPNCHERRRHQGERPRRLRTTLGEVHLIGIYWKCPHCGLCGHSAEAIAGATLSRLMRGLTCLLGTSLASFQKAELVAQRVLGVRIDDETIRQQCLAEGHAVAREADDLPEPVAEDQPLTGSCDGTMVHTRETQWREVKGYRFEHEGGRYGGAYLERVDTFAPRLAAAAQRLGAERAAQKVFLSDMAEWITQAVPRHLPGWKHIADYWHACEHFTDPAERLYGKHDPRVAKWAAYMSRRLRWYGAAKLADRLRELALHYRELDKQRAVLDLARFLDKHAPRMDYPAYDEADLPVSSGPMESFCKQIGARMKGPGMRWCTRNVTPMAMLVSRWSLEPERASSFGALSEAA